MPETDTEIREAELDLVVGERTVVADEVVALTLRSPDGAPLPEWSAGAHVDLILGDDLVRQYSLCGDPSDTSAWRVGVLREPESRGGSVAVHALAPGDTVRVRGPRNHFPLAAARQYVFIAGGIGITPILPMIREASAAGAAWELHYGGRSRATMAFLDDLGAHGERVTVTPADDAGMLDLDAALGTPRSDTLVYCCGPEGLLQAVEERCARWAPGSLHTERFTAKPVDTAGDEAFEVVFERSGITATVPPGESIFSVARANGISVLGSCLEGICGTCETDVLEGEVEHRDSVLDDDEKASNEVMMICVSRGKGCPLTLDL